MSPLLLLLVQPAQCSLEVTVVHSLTQAGLKGAEVRLRASLDTIYSVRTGEEGTARAQLPPGRYETGITKPGFLPYRGAAWECKAGASESRAFLLAPEGSISGRILDENNEPVARGEVNLLSQARGLTVGRWQPIKRMAADAQGVFRFDALEPGRYLVQVWPAYDAESGTVIRLDAPDERRKYVATYYPGVTEESTAVPVVVRAGQESSVGSIALRRVQMFRVSGRAPDASVELQVHPGGYSASKQRDGRFTFAGIPAGHYRLYAQLGDARSVTPVSVSADIDNLTVRLDPPLTARGVVKAEGSRTPDRRRLQIYAYHLDTQRGKSAEIDSSGGFTLTGLAPGPTRIDVIGRDVRDEIERWYTRAVRWNGSAVPGGELDLDASVAGLEIELRDDFATAQPTGDAKGRVTVLVLETGQGPQWARARELTAPGRVPPGDYLAFSLPSPTDLGIWEDPAWLRQNLVKMKRVTLKPNESVTIDAPLLMGF